MFKPIVVNPFDEILSCYYAYKMYWFVVFIYCDIFSNFGVW